jgi:putative transposase
MFSAFQLLVGSILRIVRTRSNLWLENLALRQQLAVLKKRHPRPQIGPFDNMFWVLARRFSAGWKEALMPSIRFATER